MSSGTEKMSVSLSTAAETHEASEQREIQALPPAVEVQCSVRLESISETLTVGNGDSITDPLHLRGSHLGRIFRCGDP